MRIGIVGLGLIGGSLAKAFKKYTDHEVFGADADPAVLRAALADGAIDGTGEMESCDVAFVCLYPHDTVKFLKNTQWKRGAVVTDICGVKRFVVERVSQELRDRGVRYAGSHPMAGKETSGYGASEADLFHGASYIITEDRWTDGAAVQTLAALAKRIGCTRVTVTTPDEHDRVIAYTSQLAHVVSNAYVKNKTAEEELGFSAGSFLDLTRVARLNAKMWAELFLANGDYLTENINELIEGLEEARRAIEQKDGPSLQNLLQEGSDLKEALDQKEKNDGTMRS